MAGDQRDAAGVPARDPHVYRLDLARWWQLLAQHLAHPSADVAVLSLTPDRELVLQSGYDWAGVKSTLDQTMAVATTQLLEETSPDRRDKPITGD